MMIKIIFKMNKEIEDLIVIKVILFKFINSLVDNFEK